VNVEGFPRRIARKTREVPALGYPGALSHDVETMKVDTQLIFTFIQQQYKAQLKVAWIGVGHLISIVYSDPEK
jgi:hypothetical protein